MRFSELTEHQRASLIQEFVPLRAQVTLEPRSIQRYIAACFVGAGFCIFGYIDALMSRPAMSAAAMLAPESLTGISPESLADIGGIHSALASID